MKADELHLTIAVKYDPDKHEERRTISFTGDWGRICNPALFPVSPDRPVVRGAGPGMGGGESQFAHRPCVSATNLIEKKNRIKLQREMLHHELEQEPLTGTNEPGIERTSKNRLLVNENLIYHHGKTGTPRNLGGGVQRAS